MRPSYRHLCRKLHQSTTTVESTRFPPHPVYCTPSALYLKCIVSTSLQPHCFYIFFIFTFFCSVFAVFGCIDSEKRLDVEQLRFRKHKKKTMFLTVPVFCIPTSEHVYLNACVSRNSVYNIGTQLRRSQEEQ